MYTSHFGLSEKPFNASPDPRFFYANHGYREAYATLLYGIRERKGFIALTGEVGTGKTTLLRRLMDDLSPAARIVFCYNASLTFDELVEFICAELELAVHGQSRIGRLQALNAFLIEEAKRGGTVALLLDEAQNLGADALENLRLISNLETSTAKLVQIVLVGQPELESKLADPALRQVAQRITIRHRLNRLSDEDAAAFIDHRLRLTGRRRRDLFTNEAVAKVVAHALGIPRVINVVCDNALLLAYAADARRVTGAMVDEVVGDLRSKMPWQDTTWPRPTPREPALRGRERAGRGRSSWLGFAGGTLIGMATAAAMGPVDIAASLPTISALADRTVAWSRRLSSEVEPAPPEPVGLPAAPAAPEAPIQTAVPLPRQAPPMPAADPTPVRGIATRGRVISMPRGRTIDQVIREHYGSYSALGLDLVQDLNPDVPDIAEVPTGKAVWLPPLNPETLLRRQTDGSYRLIVSAQPTLGAATGIVGRARRHGYTATVISRQIAPGRVLHRVEISGLRSRTAGVRAWATAKRLGWLALAHDSSARLLRPAHAGTPSHR